MPGLVDVNILLNFVSGEGEVDCEDALDINDDGSLSILDGTLPMSFVFQNGDDPEGPYPDCGVDPTDSDDLTCEGPVDFCD